MSRKCGDPVGLPVSAECWGSIDPTREKNVSQGNHISNRTEISVEKRETRPQLTSTAGSKHQPRPPIICN
ncbi:hypothetical protein TNCV_1454731 [Trichonephila clavipes]|nr:hypothetical protein TNCV_1454731 [Trichonephila clavipes]